MKPTIGRIVHFHTKNDDKPCAALVVDDSPPAGDYIMLQIFSHNGGRFHELVPVAEGESNSQGHFWRWPPRA